MKSHCSLSFRLWMAKFALGATALGATLLAATPFAPLRAAMPDKPQLYAFVNLGNQAMYFNVSDGVLTTSWQPMPSAPGSGDINLSSPDNNLSTDVMILGRDGNLIARSDQFGIPGALSRDASNLGQSLLDIAPVTVSHPDGRVSVFFVGNTYGSRGGRIVGATFSAQPTTNFYDRQNMTWKTVAGGGDPALELREYSNAQIGAALLPDNSAVTAHTTAQNTLRLSHWIWPQANDRYRRDPDALAYEAKLAEVPAPPALNKNNWDGNVDVCVSRDVLATASDSDADRRSLLWLMVRDNKGQVWITSKRIKDNGEVAPGQWSWASPELREAATDARIRSDMTNNVWLDYTTPTTSPSYRKNFQMKRRVLNSVNNIVINVGTGTATLSNFASAPVGPVNTSTRVASETLSLGTPNIDPAKAKETDEILVPVYRTWISTDSDAYGSTKFVQTTSLLGKMRRSAVINIPEKPTTQKYILLGIIEGPPPVPTQNCEDVQFEKQVGKVVFGDEISKNTDTSFTEKPGIVWKAEGAGGYPLVGHMSWETSGSIKGIFKQQNETESSTMTTQSGLAKAIPGKDGKKGYLLADGVAFLLQADRKAHIFNFVSGTGTAINSADSKLYMFASDAHIVAYPFAFDPNATEGIIPGQLHTYLMDASAIETLGKNSGLMLRDVKDTKDSATIATSWSSSGGSEEEKSFIAKTSNTYGVSVELEAMVGGGTGSKELGDYMEAKVGLSFEFEFERTFGKTQEEKLSTEVDPPYSDKEPEDFNRYAFRTFLLKENGDYEVELLKRLKYTDPDRPLLNSTLASRIMPGSKPWKITYAIQQYADGTADYAQNNPHEDAPPTSSTRTLAAARTTAPTAASNSSAFMSLQVPASLQARGITDVKSAANLLAAVRHHEERRQNPAAFRTIRHPDSTPQLDNVAQTLTIQQRNDLIGLMKAHHQQSFANFLARHPRWKPRSFPHPSTNAMQDAKTAQSAPQSATPRVQTLLRSTAPAPRIPALTLPNVR
jgi:hypothetical protein